MEMSGTPATADTTKIIQPEESSMNERISKIVVLCAVLANVIALIALVLAFVGVAKNGNSEYYIGGSGPTSDASSNGDKIWMFQIGHYESSVQYLDEASGTIKGYHVDLINAVCRMANKNCRLVWDLYERCWDSKVGERARGGIGIMGGWYDACVGWINTRDRARTMLFSAPLEKTHPPTFWVKPGSSFNYPHLTGLKVAFLDGWSSDEHCLARYDDVVGFDPSDDRQVIHYTYEDDVIAALQANEVDVAFLNRTPYFETLPDIELAHVLDADKCNIGGAALMMQKHQTELAAWFNAAFENLKATSRYQEICDNIKNEHGDQPGSDPSEICVD